MNSKGVSFGTKNNQEGIHHTSFHTYKLGVEWNVMHLNQTLHGEDGSPCTTRSNHEIDHLTDTTSWTLGCKAANYTWAQAYIYYSHVLYL